MPGYGTLTQLPDASQGLLNSQGLKGLQAVGCSSDFIRGDHRHGQPQEKYYQPTAPPLSKVSVKLSTPVRGVSLLDAEFNESNGCLYATLGPSRVVLSIHSALVMLVSFKD